MRHRLLICAVLAVWSAAPARAADVSGEIGLVSDYRYRGLSLSGGRPAMQGSVTVEHGSGLYAEAWGSTLGGGNQEIDFTSGFAADVSPHLGIDVSATYFAYPGSGSDNYFETTAIATLSRGDASAGLGLSYAPAQRGTGDEDNLYLFATAEHALPQTPLTLIAGAGYERGAFDEADGKGKWDWSLSGEVEIAPARLGLAWTGSDAGGDALVASLFFDW